MPSANEKLDNLLAVADAEAAAARDALAPDVRAAVEALPAKVRDSILRALGGLSSAVGTNKPSEGYWFGLCYGSILATQARDELPNEVVSKLLDHASTIYNPPKAEQ